MRKVAYKPGVFIVDQWGVDLGVDPHPLEGRAWEDFLSYASTLLNILAKTSPGATLFEAIAKTGKEVFIFSAPREVVKQAPKGMVDKTGLDTAAKRYPGTLESGLAQMVKDIRPAQKNFDLGLKGAPGEFQKFKSFGDESPFKKKRDLLLEQVQSVNRPTTQLAASDTLRLVLVRAKRDQALFPRLTSLRFREPVEQLARLLNISEDLFAQWLSGEKAIRDDQYYLMCCYLYDYLVPGPGTHSQIRLMHPNWVQGAFEGDLQQEKSVFRTEAQTSNLIQAVTLAHEMLHSWRMMAGRRIVSGGWEEEAMTSGVGPFIGWKLTENTFRSALKLSSRKKYSCATISSNATSVLQSQSDRGMKLSHKF